VSELGRRPAADGPDYSPALRSTGEPPGDRHRGPAGGPRRHLPLVGRAAWNLVDQVLSAATNVALSIVVVQAVGPAAFDAFAVAFLLFSTAIGVERSLVGSAMNVRHSKESGKERHRTVARATGTILALACPAALGMLVAGLLFGGPQSHGVRRQATHCGR
jgi:O-antigen/teichoic acid export membrane protein